MIKQTNRLRVVSKKNNGNLWSCRDVAIRSENMEHMEEETNDLSD